MYLDTADFCTVWKLAHNAVGLDPEKTDPENISPELREALYRILSAITWNHLSVRTRNRLILSGDDWLLDIFDIPHQIRLNRCLRGGVINPKFLDSLYVKRPEVIAWCDRDYLPIPPIWAPTLPNGKAPEPLDQDEKDDRWLTSLTSRRKQIVASLELAKRLWELKPEQTYLEIYNHPQMKMYGYPKVFSFESFKKWARPYASEFATTGGRKPTIKQL